METIETNGLNPVNDKSSIINFSGSFTPEKDGVYRTLMLWNQEEARYDRKSQTLSQ